MRPIVTLCGKPETESLGALFAKKKKASKPNPTSANP
jgi:hypothetical protein